MPRRLTALLDQLPPNLSVALAGRSQPAAPFGRYRASGQLLEIGPTSLRSTSRGLRRSPWFRGRSRRRWRPGAASAYRGRPFGTYLASIAAGGRGVSGACRSLSGAATATPRRNGRPNLPRPSARTTCGSSPGRDRGGGDAGVAEVVGGRRCRRPTGKPRRAPLLIQEIGRRPSRTATRTCCGSSSLPSSSAASRAARLCSTAWPQLGTAIAGLTGRIEQVQAAGALDEEMNDRRDLVAHCSTNRGTPRPSSVPKSLLTWRTLQRY